jgi:hypothetical protein
MLPEPNRSLRASRQLWGGCGPVGSWVLGASRTIPRLENRFGFGIGMVMVSTFQPLNWRERDDLLNQASVTSDRRFGCDIRMTRAGFSRNVSTRLPIKSEAAGDDR